MNTLKEKNLPTIKRYTNKLLHDHPFVNYNKSCQNVQAPKRIRVGVLSSGSCTFQDGTPEALARALGRCEEQRVAPPLSSLWEWTPHWLPHPSYRPSQVYQQLGIFWEFHSTPCQDTPSVPEPRRWEAPGKRKRDFDKLRFRINLQLHLCSPIEMLGAPGNNLNW